MTCGVYLMIHVQSNFFYIGSSTNIERRAEEWRNIIRLKNKVYATRGGLSRRFWSMLEDTSLKYWMFLVLKECQPAQLAKLEREEIDKARTLAPERCMNATNNTYRKVKDDTAAKEMRTMRPHV